MTRPSRGYMRHLGVLRGSGTLRCGDVVLGPAAYEIDGFCTKPGEVVDRARSAWRRPNSPTPSAAGTSS